MPELPEVETILSGIKNQIVNQKIEDVIIRQYQLRWLIPKNLKSELIKSKFLEIKRRGKYLLLSTDKGTLILHLGMSGKLQILPKNHVPGKHEHFILVFVNGKTLCLTDPRKFGAVLWTKSDPYLHKLLASLGPEPLTSNFAADYLYAKTKNRKTNVKQLIMNSKIVVGVGNIYANEALFLAKIRPDRIAGSLTKAECVLLVKTIKKVLEKAIKNGGTTISDYVRSDGSLGYFQNYLHVYGRGNEPCVKCKKLLQEIRLGNRSTVYCAECQK